MDFQDGGHLAFLTRTISAIFDLQVILMLPTRFQVNRRKQSVNSLDYFL